MKWYWPMALGVLLTHPGIGSGQAFVEHLSPPVVRRGVTNRIEIIGTETAHPVGLWTSLPPGCFTARVATDSTPARSFFDIEVTAAAPLGVYGLRLATLSGLSNVHLFVVDELPIVRRDSELPADAVQPVSLPACITAICRPAMIDRYAITVAADQRVTFEVVGNRLGKNYDPLVQIRSSTGKLIATHDHSVGLLFDCRFAHRFAEAGTYIVEVRDARYEGNPTWHYLLRMGDFPEARVAIPSAVVIGSTTPLRFPQVNDLEIPFSLPANATRGDAFHEIRNSPGGTATWIALHATDLTPSVETEPNNTRETAQSITVPGSINGHLNSPGDTDWYAFELSKDQKLVFQGVSRTIGAAADLELILFDADGREVRRVDDSGQEEGGFAFPVGKPGLHRLQVREFSRDGGGEFAYRVDVRTGGPEIQLLAESTDLTVPQGSYQALPIKVTRTEFNGEISLELRGAPTGMRIEPAVIPAGTTEFIGQVIADAATPEGIYTLEVVGSGTLESGTRIQAAASTRPMIDRQLKNVDLIPYALREDQRLLPPSLLQKIALMVVPPVPFTAETPESVLALTRFQTAEFPIVTTRQPGFVSPITFAVKGGQIGDEAEERNQVYARFVPGTVERLTGTGTFFNRINTQLNKHRVDLTASAMAGDRRINLVRAFTLDVRSAFKPAYEPDNVSALPGETVRVKIHANRVPTFDGLVELTMSPQFGLTFPVLVQIPAGQPFVEVEIKVDPKLNPGRHGIRVEAAGFVGKYEESFNLPNLQIEVQKPAKQ